MIPPFRVYLSDVDGTLVDSAEDICGAIQGVLASTHQNAVPLELLRGYIGRHLADLFEDLFPMYTTADHTRGTVRQRWIRRGASKRNVSTVSEGIFTCWP